MGGRINIKIVLLAFFLVISLSLLSTSALSENSCCISTTNQCSPITLISERTACTLNNGQINPLPCYQISGCDSGCCCGNTNNKYSNRFNCPSGLTVSTVNIAGWDEDSCRTACGSSTPSCTFTHCDGSNTLATIPSGTTCQCGDRILSPSGAGGTFCCSADSTIATNQNSCQSISTVCTSTATYYSISGTVINTSNGNPLPGTRLTTTSGQQTDSDQQGKYTLSGILPSVGNITATYSSFTVKKNYTISSATGNINNFDIYINARTLAEICSTPDIDSDNDGCLAKYDSDCQGFINEASRGLCNDHVDNDCNNRIDCYDSGCALASNCATTPATFCGDGIKQTPNSFQFPEECDYSGTTCPSASNCCSSGKTCYRCNCIDTTPRCGDGFRTGSEACDPGLPRSEWSCTSTQLCDPITCQCTSQISGCGNAILTSPPEECEFTTTSNYNAVIQGSLCDFGQCIQPGYAGACLCTSTIMCGNSALNPGEDCDYGITSGCTGDTSCNYENCKCESCTATSKTPALTNRTVSGQVELSWTVGCTSPLPNNYLINRCAIPVGSSTCVPTIRGPTGAPTDSLNKKSMEMSGRYCYTVTAMYGSTAFESNRVCSDSPSVECTTAPGYYFCSGTNLNECVDGVKVRREDCASTPNGFCLNLPASAVGAQCATQSPCNNCTGAFSMFSSTPGSTIFEIINNIPLSTACSASQTCYLDYTNTSVDKYHECRSVSSCYDYNSEFACNNNKCSIDPEVGVANSCEWLNSTKFKEIGIGVCRPKQTSKQNCRLCTDSYPSNYFFGGCDKSLCSLYGTECYYQNTTSLCLNKYEISCNDYASEQDCTNGINSTVDTSWADIIYTNKRPTGGSNNHTVLSRDFFSFNYCRWSSTDYCFKDGNGNNLSDRAEYCFGSLRCNRDFYPPNTSVIYSNTNTLGKKLSLPVIVYDNESNETETSFFYFNITKNDGTRCYPSLAKNVPSPNLIRFNMTFPSKNIIYNMITDGRFEENNTGRYTFCYFSEDSHLNFEILRNITIKVDTKDPDVVVEIKNSSYETSSSISSDGFTWLTDLNITVSLNETENATCSLWLSTFQTPRIANIRLQNKKPDSSNKFYVNYSALEDGVYTFHAECEDIGGNNNSNRGEVQFKIDADKKITDLLPNNRTYGPNDEVNRNIFITLRARTQNISECRFTQDPVLASSVLINPSDFLSMTKFNITNTADKIHYHNLTYNGTSADDFQDPPWVYNYYIRCNNSISGKIIGNSGDMVTFGIDYVPPITDFVDSNNNPIIIDERKWYRRSELPTSLKLKCVDPEMKFGAISYNRDYASGCIKINYTYNSLNTLINSNETQIVLPVNNISVVSFQGIDAAGNKELLHQDVRIKIDDEKSLFEFKIFRIFPDGTEEKVNTVTWGRKYRVEINASKKKPSFDSAFDFDTINDLGFYLGTARTRVGLQGFTSLPYTGGFRWQAFLNISTRVPSGTGEFFFSTTDTHGVTSDEIVNKIFNIDTSDPNKPVFNPPFEQISGGFGLIYPDTFYSLNTTYSRDNIYYTNDKNLFVTGSSDEGILDFYMNDVNNPYKNYTQTQNAASSPINNYITSAESVQGSSNLTFDNDVTPDFVSGRYIFMTGTDNHRKNYTHFKEYYKITGAQVIGPTTVVYISPSLEKTFASGQNVEIYNKMYPHDWFGTNLSLIFGKNLFFTKITNGIGNLKKSDEYQIYFDNSTPIRLGSWPISGSKIGNNNLTINMTILDKGTGLDLAATTLMIDNEVITPSITKSYTNDGTYDNYKYIINYSKIFTTGNHLVLFETKDLSRNTLKFNFSFYTDPNLPSQPSFMLEGLNRSDSYDEDLFAWFTNKTRNFLINFTDILTVNVTNVTLYNYSDNSVCGQDENFILRDVADCRRIIPSYNNNSFNCSFKDTPAINSAINRDDNYLLNISVTKYLNIGTLTGNSLHCFVRDTTPPGFNLSFSNRTRSNVNLSFDATLLTKEKTLKAYFKFDVDSNYMEIIPNNRSNIPFIQDYLFRMVVPPKNSGDYDFTLYLKDYAGNINSTRKTLTIDNETPTLQIKNITTLALYLSSGVLETRLITNFDELRDLQNNTRFRGTLINIRGNLSPDVESVTLVKMDGNNNMIPPTLILNNTCSLPIESGKGCFQNGNFTVINFSINGNSGVEEPYYLFFNVTDKAQNYAYYSSRLYSDLRPPDTPSIIITELN